MPPKPVQHWPQSQVKWRPATLQFTVILVSKMDTTLASDAKSLVQTEIIESMTNPDAMSGSDFKCIKKNVLDVFCAKASANLGEWSVVVSVTCSLMLPPTCCCHRLAITQHCCPAIAVQQSTVAAPATSTDRQSCPNTTLCAALSKLNDLIDKMEAPSTGTPVDVAIKALMEDYKDLYKKVAKKIVDGVSSRAFLINIGKAVLGACDFDESELD